MEDITNYRALIILYDFSDQTPSSASKKRVKHSKFGKPDCKNQNDDDEIMKGKVHISVVDETTEISPVNTIKDQLSSAVPMLLFSGGKKMQGTKRKRSRSISPESPQRVLNLPDLTEQRTEGSDMKKSNRNDTNHEEVIEQGKTMNSSQTFPLYSPTEITSVQTEDNSPSDTMDQDFNTSPVTKVTFSPESEHGGILPIKTSSKTVQKHSKKKRIKRNSHDKLPTKREDQVEAKYVFLTLFFDVVSIRNYKTHRLYERVNIFFSLD